MASIPNTPAFFLMGFSSSYRSPVASTTGTDQLPKTKIQCNSLVNQQQSFFTDLRTATGDREDGLLIKHKERLAGVRSILSQVDDSLESMIAIDTLQRFGIDYYFKEEIQEFLSSLYLDFGGSGGDHKGSLFEVALFFRLLRQAGYNVSSDLFIRFMDMKGRFEPSLSEDIKGMLCLYEASHLNMGEDILYKANEFSSKHLKNSIEVLEPDVARLVRQTMEHPYHLSIQRYKARQHLSHSQGAFGVLQELAVLDFNIVQSLNQRELREVSSWWKNLGLAQELSFAREQPLKWYMWPMNVISDPRYSKQRIELTKTIAFIYLVDDIFDVYGTLDELSLFTEAINRWELSAIDTLPRYMGICYKALYIITNEIAQMVLKEYGWNPINSLRKSWMTLFEAFLVEAKWFASGHVPKADEYLRNGVISSGVHTVLVHLFFLLGQGITKENVHLVENNPTLISYPATILRLSDDLGSAKDEKQEGFDGSYVELYMKEHPSCSVGSARDHVMHMISDTWESLNRECLSPSPFPPSFVTASLNTSRMVRVMYSYDNNQRLPILEEYITSLLSKTM